MDAFWNIVASNALIVALLAMFVALLSRFWKNPQALHFLWVIVLVKLLLPPLVMIPLTLPTLKGVSLLTGTPGVASTSARTVSGLVGTTVPAQPPSSGGDPILDRPVNAKAIDSVQPDRFSLGLVIACLWGTGSVCVAIGYGIAIIRFNSCLRFAQLASPEIVVMAQSVGNRLGLRRIPRIALAPIRISPLVWAVACKARVILPLELCQRLSPKALQSILAHELAHVKRKDHLIRLLELLTSTLFWWHPVTWWAASRLRELEEECCDAIVIAVASCDARSYATALVDTLDYLSIAPPVSSVAATTAHPMATLTRRIEMLQANAYPARLRRSKRLLLAAMAGLPAAIAFAVTPATDGIQPLSRPAAEQQGVGDSRQGRTEFHGIVMDQQYRPIAGAEVVLTGQLEGSVRVASLATATTNDAGEFNMRIGTDDAPRWKVWSTGVVWARAEGHALGMRKVHPRDLSDVSQFKVTLSPSNTTELTLRDTDGKALSGTVERIQVFHEFLPAEFLLHFPSKIDDQGRLVLRGLPYDANDTADPRSIWIRTANLGLQEFTWWHHADPALVKRVTLTARPLITVQGSLFGAKDLVAADILGNVDVSLETLFGNTNVTPGDSWCRGHATAKTDASGRFQIDIAAGRLMSAKIDLPQDAKLRAVLPGREIVWQPGAVHHVSIPLYPTRTLRGVVRRASGEPVLMEFSVTHGNLVRECNGDQVSMSGVFRETFCTDATGHYEHEVLGGDVALARNMGLGSNMAMGLLWKTPAGVPDGLLNVPAGREPFDLPPIEIHTITGRVMDDQRQPLTSGFVMLSDGKKGCGVAGIGGDGTFRCDTVVLPDNYSVGTGNGTGLVGELRAATIVSKSPLVIRVADKAVPNDR